jgi:hypothetical protein
MLCRPNYEDSPKVVCYGCLLLLLKWHYLSMRGFPYTLSIRELNSRSPIRATEKPGDAAATHIYAYQHHWFTWQRKCIVFFMQTLSVCHKRCIICMNYNIFSIHHQWQWTLSYWGSSRQEHLYILQICCRIRTFWLALNGFIMEINTVDW